MLDVLGEYPTTKLHPSHLMGFSLEEVLNHELLGKASQLISF